MAMKYTEEQLNNFDKAVLVQLLLSNQEQLASIDQKLQLVLEQLASANHKRYGRSSEKLYTDHQIAFKEVDDQFVFFNEAEAVINLDEVDYEEIDTLKLKPGKRKGKREEDLKGLPIVKIEHTMTEELRKKFGEKSWKQLPDEAYKRYKFTPSKVEVEEHHVAVYASKKDDHIIKAKHPGYLLRSSLVSPSLEAAILNGKYVNAVPLCRLEKEFERYNLKISR